ncbi:MAG: hypothetical protein ACKV22_02175 [Bryobacteraceae bacterium]
MLIAWVRERFKLRLAVPLVAGLCAIAYAAGTWPGSGRAAAIVVLAILLLLQFRLWDDLADLPSDRKNHPERTLPRARSLRPFRIAVLLLATACMGLMAVLDPSGVKVAALAGLDLTFLCWYRFRAGGFALGYHVVLMKYPLFVYFVTPEPAGKSRLFAMAAVYLAACIYEALHDAGLRGIWAARYAAAVEATLLGATGVAALVGGGW